MFWPRKDSQWSESLSSNSPFAEEALDLHVRDDPLADDDFPLIAGHDAMWCSGAAPTPEL
jgi:hypothetical protein